MTSHARSTDPATSQAAGAAVPNEVNAGTFAHQALQAYAEAGSEGLTADEVDEATQVDGIWKRCSDLKGHEFIEPVLGVDDQPIQRISRYGKGNEVFRVTQAGLDHLEHLKTCKPKRRRKRYKTLEQQWAEIIREYLEPAESLRGFGTTQLRGDREQRAMWNRIKSTVQS